MISEGGWPSSVLCVDEVGFVDFVVAKNPFQEPNIIDISVRHLYGLCSGLSGSWRSGHRFMVATRERAIMA